ncbi:DUF6259 domain-containing protein [Reichenbachiella sp. MALMAid0571]|uniref:DUF6259 domain-containing protein n=1 Tax=Reichenbachiella sp. MALMAid0571 TaxID=3143939 RepID=UPI0032DF9315
MRIFLLRKLFVLFQITVICYFFVSCLENKGKINFYESNDMFLLENKNIRIELDRQLKIRVYHIENGVSKSITRKNKGPHYLVVNGVEVKDFIVKDKTPLISEISTEFGNGRRFEFVGIAKGPLGATIEKKVEIELYERHPNSALVRAIYKNLYATPGLFIEKEIDNAFDLDASLVNEDNDKHSFWILQGGSYVNRPDWILPVTENFSSDNYQGRRPEDGIIGGGLPVLDVWNEETGFFIGSIRKKPTPISLPAKVNNGGVFNIGIEYARDSIPFTQEYSTLPTVLGVHNGDYYNGLQFYSAIMKDNGFKIPKPDLSSAAYERIWCGWGYGPGFKMNQMTDMIPLVQSMHFKVATIDYGWFYYNGDFEPRDDSFPRGEEDMKSMVQAFHDKRMQVKLWITPGAAGPQLVKEHPEWLIMDRDGTPMYVNDHFGEDRPQKYEEALLCPVLDEVKEYYRGLIKTIIGEWGYDGLKMDFSFTNASGNCYAVDHNHQYPQESFEALPDLYQTIYEESINIKPDAILEMCPCGMFPSFYKMPYYNQPVASDPNNQWQLRHRAKTIKALMGAQIPFYGDHVERYYDKNSFASMVGVGAVPGTMFVDKAENRFNHPSKSVRSIALTSERKADFDKWINIHKENELSRGEYLNLYDIAYDKPETHVVSKNNILYYAFYADNWDGDIEFRGLESGEYQILNYVNDKIIGRVKQGGKLKIAFRDYLLVKAVPEIQ